MSQAPDPRCTTTFRRFANTSAGNRPWSIHRRADRAGSPACADHDHHRQPTGTFSTKPTITNKQALSWATVEGARALGLDDRVGRLEAGRQADLIVIDASATKLWPAPDPIATALYATAGDIDAVMVAGRWRKRHHALLDVDLDAVRTRLSESADHLLPHLAG